MADARGTYWPGSVPNKRVPGYGSCGPALPKSAPVPAVQSPAVSSGPACERSTVPLAPEMLIEVVLVEFTWMERCGPPQIWIVFEPFLLKAPEAVGCSTRIGTG